MEVHPGNPEPSVSTQAPSVLRFYALKTGAFGKDSNVILEVRPSSLTVAVIKEKTSKLKYELPWTLFENASGDKDVKVHVSARAVRHLRFRTSADKGAFLAAVRGSASGSSSHESSWIQQITWLQGEVFHPRDQWGNVIGVLVGTSAVHQGLLCITNYRVTFQPGTHTLQHGAARWGLKELEVPLRGLLSTAIKDKHKLELITKDGRTLRFEFADEQAAADVDALVTQRGFPSAPHQSFAYVYRRMRSESTVDPVARKPNASGKSKLDARERLLGGVMQKAKPGMGSRAGSGKHDALSDIQGATFSQLSRQARDKNNKLAAQAASDDTSPDASADTDTTTSSPSLSAHAAASAANDITASASSAGPDMDQSPEVSTYEPTSTSLTEEVGWMDSVDAMEAEYRRVGLIGKGLSPFKKKLNGKYELCGTYPSVLILPKALPDSVIKEASEYRSRHRLPAVVWCNAHLNEAASIDSEWADKKAVPEPMTVVHESKDENQPQQDADDTVPSAERSNTVPQSFAPPPPPPPPASAPQASITTSSAGDDDTPPALLSSQSTVNQPVFCTIARCAQPQPGMTGSRSAADEQFLTALRRASGNRERYLIVDARPKINAVGNQLKGKGYEDANNYENCQILFMGIENIHQVRASFQAVQALVESGNYKNWLSRLEQTRWLAHLESILTAGTRMASGIHDDHVSMLVHCSDGWDRTSQLTSLSMLLLDPFYRTMRGFMVLIQKEWLWFGHKFADRCGTMASDGVRRDKHEWSPIFLQFLDCTHQLLLQFPHAFEFNQAFLVSIMDGLLSGLYGTFWGNCMQEREQHEFAANTHSLWTYLSTGDRPALHRNPFYAPQLQNSILRPMCSTTSLRLWDDFFMRWRRPRTHEYITTPYHEPTLRLLFDRLRAERAELQGRVAELEQKLTKPDE